MKFTLIILSILLVILLLGVFELIYLENTFDFLKEKTDSYILKQQEGTLSKEDATSLLNFWEKKKRILHLLVNHTEISKIEDCIYKLKAHKDLNEDKETLGILIELNEIAKNIMFNFNFNIQNII